MTNIFVTGSKGFLGKALSSRLNKLGYTTIPFDLEDGDIADEQAFTKYLGEKISHVFHLAAVTFVPDSWIRPFNFYRTNVLGTTNILEFCRKTNSPLTYVSSYVYGSPKYLPIDEDHPRNPFNPYNHSKIIAEDICSFYTSTFKVRTTIFRPFNIYGPGQSDSFVIPLIIKQVLSNNNMPIEVADLEPRRDFVYIDDVINALLLSLNGAVGVYNIGSGVSYSVEEIIKLILHKSQINKTYISRNIKRQNEVTNVVANISKISRELRWVPQTSFEKGIENCIRYYR